MVNINSEVIVERIQKDGVNTIIIAAVIAILSWIFNMLSLIHISEPTRR